MRSVPLPNGSPRVRLSRTLPRAGPLLVLAAVVAVLALTPAGATWGGNPPPVAYGWNNGSVLCAFNASLPSVTVSAQGSSGTGMGVGLTQITELSPQGVVVASAVMGSVVWDPNDTSSTTAFVMSYGETVPVTSPTAPTPPVGSVQVNLSYSLARSPTSLAQANQVSVQVLIQHWPWQNVQDTLALEVPIWSAFATSEHVVVGSATSPRVDSVSSANGQSLEYFQAATSATTTAGSPVAVTAHTTVMAGKGSTTLTFGTGAGGASSLTYQATLGITPSTQVLGVPLYDYAAVAGGAGLVALAVGAGTSRIRRRPSDLTFVEEDE
ncbi:MAG: hypothetical protein L3K14_02135 [Thermoplasmata archaeon]|nr:hypothetical protein [Thermoplasmata archaeon]